MLGQAIKRAARIGLHQLGGLEPILWRTRRNFRILTYHRFSERLYPGSQAALSRQCEFLKKHFHVIPMPDLSRALSGEAPLPARALVVTVDDGYRDFLTDAFPVFDKWKIPATVYLISDFIDGKLWPWWDQVQLAVMQTGRELVTVSIEGADEELPLKTAAQREEALERILARLKRIPDQARRQFMARLPGTFETNIPREAPVESAALNWNEVRKLAGAGIGFGAHTKSHPILPMLATPEELKEEIAASKERIEKELGQPVLDFCYPNGDWDDATEAAVEQCGFATAVTTVRGLNQPGANRYRLKRFSIEPGLPGYYFREEVAGMHAG